MSDAFNPILRPNLAAVHSASTKPELALRHGLWRRGFRYRINDNHLPGKPDIVLPKYRTVIFVHGCFWHGHHKCKYYTIPKTNSDFWSSKIANNQEHDQDVWRRLEAMGWAVIIVWECQLKKDHINDTIRLVTDELFQNGQHFIQIKQARKISRIKYLHERQLAKEKEAILMNELHSVL